jgi:hypothetical protein
MAAVAFRDSRFFSSSAYKTSSSYKTMFCILCSACSSAMSMSKHRFGDHPGDVFGFPFFAIFAS